MSVVINAPLEKVLKPSFKWLLRKELLQLQPLAAMFLLFVLLGLIMGGFASFFQFSQGWNGAIVFSIVSVLGFPQLFAIGAAGMLVGIEKEKRTITWLQSLPIGSRRIVVTKLQAGLIGLGLAWIASLLTLWLLSVFFGEPRNPFAGESLWLNVLALFSFSVYLLMAGMAFSWRFNNAYTYLFCLLFVGPLPYLVFSFVESGYRQQFGTLPDAYFLVGVAIVSLTGGVFFAWLSLLFGNASLAAEVIPNDRSIKHRQKIEEQETDYKTHFLSRHPAPPFSALIWHQMVQLRWFLAILAAMYLTGGLMILLTEYWESVNYRYPRSTRSSLSGFAYTVWFLASGWLGAVTFAVDNVNDRIRFLADRGIPAGQIWLSRLLVTFLPILFVIGIIMGPSMLMADTIADWYHQQMVRGAVVVLTILIPYGVGLWGGQVFRHGVMATLSIPIIALLVIVLAVLENYLFMGTAWGVFLFLIVAPLATRVLCRTWVDRNIHWKFFVGHGLFLVGWIATAFLIPIISQRFLIERADSQVLATIRGRAEARGGDISIVANSPYIHGSVVTLSEDLSDQGYLVSSDPAAQTTATTADTTLESRESRTLAPSVSVAVDRQLDHLESTIKGLSRLPSSISNIAWIDFLINRARISRSVLSRVSSDQLSPDSSAEESERNDSIIASDNGLDSELLEHYRRHYQRSIELLNRVAIIYRQQPTLMSQETADRLDQFLLSELMQLNSHDSLTAELHYDIAARLADVTTRRMHRLDSIAAALAFSDRQTQTIFVGDLPIPGLSASPYQIFTGDMARFFGERTLVVLWELAMANTDQAKMVQRKKLRELWETQRAGHASFAVDNGVDQTNALTMPRFFSLRDFYLQPIIPGQFVGADWEDQAVQFHQELLKNKIPQERSKTD